MRDTETIRHKSSKTRNYTKDFLTIEAHKHLSITAPRTRSRRSEVGSRKSEVLPHTALEVGGRKSEVGSITAPRTKSRNGTEYIFENFSALLVAIHVFLHKPVYSKFSVYFCITNKSISKTNYFVLISSSSSCKSRPAGYSAQTGGGADGAQTAPLGF